MFGRKEETLPLEELRNIIVVMVMKSFKSDLRTGLDFKFAQFDHVRVEAEDWIKMRGLEI